MSDNSNGQSIGDDAIELLRNARQQIFSELSNVIVGQQDVVEQILISMFSRGHCLLEGVPGLAKTLMISTIAKTLNLSFSRIQFTPDLMPSDITGTEVIEENKTTSFLLCLPLPATELRGGHSKHQRARSAGLVLSWCAASVFDQHWRSRSFFRQHR